MAKKLVGLLIAFSRCFLIACSEREDDGVITGERYTGPFSDVNGAYGGVDDLGRTLAEALRSEKQNRTDRWEFFISYGWESTAPEGRMTTVRL